MARGFTLWQGEFTWDCISNVTWGQDWHIIVRVSKTIYFQTRWSFTSLNLSLCLSLLEILCWSYDQCNNIRNLQSKIYCSTFMRKIKVAIVYKVCISHWQLLILSPPLVLSTSLLSFPTVQRPFIIWSPFACSGRNGTSIVFTLSVNGPHITGHGEAIFPHHDEVYFQISWIAFLTNWYLSSP